MTDTLLVLPGPPAFSAFRLSKLLAQARAADPAVTGAVCRIRPSAFAAAAI